MKKSSIVAVLALAALTRNASAQEKTEAWANPAGALAAAGSIADVKTNAPMAVAALTAPAPAVYTPASLMKMKWADLQALYKTLAPGEIPDGVSNGLASSDPGTTMGGVSEDLFGLLWKGKIFDRANGQLINRILGMRLVTAQVYVGPSWLDGNPSIIIDYQSTSKLAGFIRDEIREVSPGVYFGFAYERSATPKAPIVFALDFNAPKAAPPAPTVAPPPSARASDR